MTARMIGKVRHWKSESGFGFIQPDGAFESIFCHRTQIRKTGLNELSRGQQVSFEVGPGRDGRQMAVNVELA